MNTNNDSSESDQVTLVSDIDHTHEQVSDLSEQQVNPCMCFGPHHRPASACDYCLGYEPVIEYQ